MKKINFQKHTKNLTDEVRFYAEDIFDTGFFLPKENCSPYSTQGRITTFKKRTNEVALLFSNLHGDNGFLTDWFEPNNGCYHREEYIENWGTGHSIINSLGEVQVYFLPEKESDGQDEIIYYDSWFRPKSGCNYEIIFGQLIKLVDDNSKTCYLSLKAQYFQVYWFEESSEHTPKTILSPAGDLHYLFTHADGQISIVRDDGLIHTEEFMPHPNRPYVFRKNKSLFIRDDQGMIVICSTDGKVSTNTVWRK